MATPSGYALGSRPAFNVTKRATSQARPSTTSNASFLIRAAVVGGVVAASLYVLSQRRSSTTKDTTPTKPPVEAHETKDASGALAELKAAALKLRPTMPFSVRATRVADDAPVSGANQKKVHFIRHGQGFHNVAQREW